LLHEARRRALARSGDAADLEGQSRRRMLGEQRDRLGNLSQLLDGLVHLDQDQASVLDRRIRELEQELHGLMRRAVAPALDA
ncbi:MAG: hypothetical protein ACTHOC_03870, partial [Luteimonas sp.]